MSGRVSKRQLEVIQITEGMTDAERRLLLVQLREWQREKEEVAATRKENTLIEQEEAAAQEGVRRFLQIVKMQKRPVYGYEDDHVQYAAKVPYDGDKVGLSQFAGGAWAFFVGAPKPPQKLREEEKAELSRALRLAFPAEILTDAAGTK